MWPILKMLENTHICIDLQVNCLHLEIITVQCVARFYKSKFKLSGKNASVCSKEAHLNYGRNSAIGKKVFLPH